MRHQPRPQPHSTVRRRSGDFLEPERHLLELPRNRPSRSQFAAWLPVWFDRPSGFRTSDAELQLPRSFVNRFQPKRCDPSTAPDPSPAYGCSQSIAQVPPTSAVGRAHKKRGAPAPRFCPAIATLLRRIPTISRRKRPGSHCPPGPLQRRFP